MDANGYFVANYVFPDAAEGKIIIDVKVKAKGSKEYHLVSAMIDTGADSSCLSKKLARKLELISKENVKPLDNVL